MWDLYSGIVPFLSPLHTVGCQLAFACADSPRRGQKNVAPGVSPGKKLRILLPRDQAQRGARVKAPQAPSSVLRLRQGNCARPVPAAHGWLAMLTHSPRRGQKNIAPGTDNPRRGQKNIAPRRCPTFARTRQTVHFRVK